MSFSKIFFFLCRCWLWLLILVGLVGFSPIWSLIISFERTYPLFHLFCRWWCRLVLLLNGFWYFAKISKKIEKKSAYIICPNHTSKLDVILLFAVFPGTFVFVGKQKITKIPFFEWFYNKTMITFDRSSVSSGFRAYRKADRLLKLGRSIVLFPEGGVPPKEVRLQKFKLGAFKLAIQNQVPIIPVTFVDNKNKHPEDELELKWGALRVYLHKPIESKNIKIENANQLRDKAFNIINKTLINHEN